MTVRPLKPAALSALFFGLSVAAGSAVDAQQPPARPAVAATPRPTTTIVHYVLVSGADYNFAAPETVPAGIVTFNLVNNGADLHAMAVFELPADHSLRDFVDQYHAQRMIPSWMRSVGYTETLAPKAETFLTMRLTPGRYILACLIPARDGRMHTEKGMVKLITVK